MWVVGDSIYAQGLAKVLSHSAMLEAVNVSAYVPEAPSPTQTNKPAALLVVDAGETRQICGKALCLFPDTSIIYFSANREYMTVVTATNIQARSPDLLNLLVTLTA